ncbi:MAG TPA: hypothetical protein H9694_06535 [Firmicutes bacterium]|nr:hypothetical protein [Bacillota bacterium]
MVLRENYENLPQRISNMCLFYFSPLNTIQSEGASQQSQAGLHALFESIWMKIADEPELLGLEPVPDDSYMLIQSANRKPELNLQIHQIYYQLTELFSMLLYCGYYGEICDEIMLVKNFKKRARIKIKNKNCFFNNVRLLKSLNLDLDLDQKSDTLRIGCQDDPKIFAAWKLLSNQNFSGDKISESGLFAFMFCCFDRNFDYLLRKAEKHWHLQPMFLTSFFMKFIEQGYQYEWNCSIFGTSFTVYNDITGFRIQMQPAKIQQIYFRINRIIGSVKAIMDYDHLSSEAQEFIRTELADCSNCGHCMKNGKKKSIYIQNRELCIGSLWMVRDGGFPFRGEKYFDNIYAFVSALPDYS